jgi:uncharacterized protein (TIGR00255 family)
MASVASMTGYARAESSSGSGSWQWEVKCVNGRGLDVHCRLGNGLDRLEPAVRERAARALGRGSLSVSLRVSADPALRAVTVNRELVQQILDAAADVAGDAGAKPSLDAVFAIPGVVEIGAPLDDPAARDALDATLLGGLDRALAELREFRQAEGSRIVDVCAGHLDEIDALRREASETAAAQPARIRDRLAEKLAALLAPGAVAEDRLAQEVALLAIKADVREELDRLAVHVEAARELLAGGGAVGRKLDFLSQEMSREANTLCAKSSDAELSRAGLALKTVIDRLREQVQNLE